MSTPVYDESTGEMLRDYLYVYFKNANERMESPGLQGGITPVKIGPDAVVDPYGHSNELYQAEPEFADYFCAAMGATMSRFEGIRSSFKQRPNGGIGAFTPDNLPVLDWVAPNVYMIEDSNHGFKMIGIGKLVSKLLMGEDVPDLKPSPSAATPRARPSAATTAIRRGCRRSTGPIGLGTRPDIGRRSRH